MANVGSQSNIHIEGVRIDQAEGTYAELVHALRAEELSGLRDPKRPGKVDEAFAEQQQQQSRFID